jgi:predicted phage terminase large subunit-like protein
LIEDKANGPAVLAMLRREIPRLNEGHPKGGKEARMNAAAPAIKSQNVWLPHPALHPWVNDFLKEAEAAPMGTYMDQVDSASQYLNHRYDIGSSVVQRLSSW